MTIPVSIQEHQRVQHKPRTKRKEARKRSPKVCTEQCNSTDVETGSKSRHSIPNNDGDSAAALTKDYYDTPNIVKQGTRQSSSHDYIEAQTQPELTSTYHAFFCISNLGSLHPNDRNYLESQGCTRVPDSRCLDELLLAFFRYAHPILPVINEAEFWSAYESQTTGGMPVHVPLVLLSAMLFVACNYVEDHVIQSMDFAASHKAAEDFRRKTKLLYDYETECSPLVLAQVSLLLAHWTPQRLGGKGTHWLGRAINHAHDAFAESKLWSFSEKCSSLSCLRRVWRGCVLSDRIHSLYTRRPLTIPVEMAEKDDHGPMLLRADLSHEIGRSRVYSAKVQQRCIKAQERMSDLCTILGRVLTLAYPSTGSPAFGSFPMTIGLEIEFRECKKHLKAWHSHMSSQFAEKGVQALMLGSRIGSDDGREDTTPYNEPVGLLLSMMYLHYEIFGTALSLFLHHLGTNQQPHTGEWPSNIGLLKHNLIDVDVQRLRNSGSMRKVIDCLRLRFRPELEYLLQAIEAIIKSAFQEFEGILDDSSLSDCGEHEFQPVKGSLRIHDWCELLDSRPKLYIQLIDTFDNTISCGGSLPETDLLYSTSGRYEPPRYDLNQKSQPDKRNLPFSPALSNSESQMNSAGQTSIPLFSGDGSIKHLESCLQDSNLPSSADLESTFDNILSQKVRSLESDTTEATDEFPSPRLSDTSWGVLSNDIAVIEKAVQDQTRNYGGDNGVKTDCQKMQDFTMGNGLDDSWMEAVLEDAAMLEDDTPKEADHPCDYL
ncbi:hypothetical protein CC79DRAFT_1370715 [Sarocladium strictum]